LRPNGNKCKGKRLKNDVVVKKHKIEGKKMQELSNSK
jgi:hypothetical protein